MKKVKIEKRARYYPGVIFMTPSELSKKEAKNYTRDLIKRYDEAGKGLDGFEKEGIKLMKSLHKTMDEMEKSDSENSVFLMRQAEFMVADWLNEINPYVKYGAVS